MPESTIKNKIFENNKETELPSQFRTGTVTAINLTSSSSPENFNPGWRFYASFTSLCIITLAVALDATSLSVALPVIAPSIQPMIGVILCGTIGQVGEEYALIQCSNIDHL